MHDAIAYAPYDVVLFYDLRVDFKLRCTMFDDKFFEDWLANQAQKVMEKVANGEGIAPEQMMILMLKAQTNHFAHLDVDLRNEMVLLREDMDARFEQAKLESARQFEQVDKRLEQFDKRFEQVDKRFEQFDKRFELLTSRIDHFMIWSFATTISVGGIIVAAIKFLE
ncbi:MAG: hypothetical protein QX195_01225 [Methylococcaceae bacterium]